MWCWKRKDLPVFWSFPFSSSAFQSHLQSLSTNLHLCADLCSHSNVQVWTLVSHHPRALWMPFPRWQQNITADRTKLGYVTSVTALQLPAQTELGNSWTLLTHLQFRFLRAGLVAPVCLSPCWAGSHNYQVKKSHSSLPFSFKNISLL